MYTLRGLRYKTLNLKNPGEVPKLILGVPPPPLTENFQKFTQTQGKSSVEFRQILLKLSVIFIHVRTGKFLKVHMYKCFSKLAKI